MTITIDMVKDLRQKTGAGIMDCKEALKETKGNIEEAVTTLRKKGKQVAENKKARTAKQGTVGSYLHMGGKIGVLVEVNCETDFVARNDNFKAFVKDVAMQIAAAAPTYVSRDEISPETLKAEEEIISAQIDKNKPERAKEGIKAGKIKKYCQERCLLEQAYIRDPKTTIKDCLDAIIAKTGENIVIARFVRFVVGEES